MVKAFTFTAFPFTSQGGKELQPNNHMPHGTSISQRAVAMGSKIDMGKGYIICTLYLSSFDALNTSSHW